MEAPEKIYLLGDIDDLELCEVADELNEEYQELGIDITEYTRSDLYKQAKEYCSTTLEVAKDLHKTLGENRRHIDQLRILVLELKAQLQQRVPDVDAEELCDRLYRAGYVTREKERDYDPRGHEAWQACLDRMAPQPPEAGQSVAESGCCCGETEQAWRLCPEHGPKDQREGE